MVNNYLERAYAANSPEELSQVYAEWAKSYDNDLIAEMGWDKPDKVASALLPHLPPNANILDVAAGTGLMGLCLYQQGQQNLSALDFSKEMLEQAKTRGVYRHIHHYNLLESLPLKPQSYDAVTAVGAFTQGHLGPQVLPKLIALLKPGGLLAFSLRDDLETPYKQALAKSSLVQRQQFSHGLKERPWSAWIYKA